MKRSINASHYDRIPAFPSAKKKRARIVNAIVETPKGSCHKYSLAPEYGLIAFDSLLPDGLEWPYDFGFVPQTLARDGDPIDILLVNDAGLFPGCLIPARIVGCIRESKDGVENDRLIGVPVPSHGAPAATDAYYDIADLPPHLLDRIETFLADYSREQGHEIVISAVVGADDAMSSIKRCMHRFQKHTPKA